MLQSPFVIVCAMAAAAGGFSFGFDQGVISIILVEPQFLAQFPLVDAAVSPSASFCKGLLTAMLEFGAFLGALQSGFVSDKFSRRRTLFNGVVWFVVGSVLQTTAFSYAQLVVGRLIGGVGIGTLAAVAPLYISELAPPNIRGTLLVMESFMIVLGVVVAYYVSFATRNMASDWSFRLPFLVQITPALVLAVLFFFLPYSPRWLVSKGRDGEALATLCRLRRLPRDSPFVLAELIAIKAESAVQYRAEAVRHPNVAGKPGLANELALEALRWKDMFAGAGIFQRTHIGLGLGFFQQFIGINALIYYGPSLFEAVGLDFSLQLTMSGVMNICQLVGVAPVFYLLDRVGRRPLVIYGGVCVCLSHAIIAALIGVYGLAWQRHEAAAWVCVAFIFTYMIAFGATWSPVPWALPAEMFPSTFRAKGTALATCSIWLNNFIIGLITPSLIGQVHGAGAFVFFAVFSAVGTVWCYAFVPETRGKSLEDMDKIFGDDSAVRDAAMREACMVDVLAEVQRLVSREGVTTSTAGGDEHAGDRPSGGDRASDADSTGDKFLGKDEAKTDQVFVTTSDA